MKTVETVLDTQAKLQQEGAAIVSRIDTLYADYNRLYDEWLLAASLEAAAQLRGKPEDRGSKGLLAQRKKLAGELSTLSRQAETYAQQIRASIPEVNQAIEAVKAKMEPFQRLLDTLKDHQTMQGSREGDLTHRIRSYPVSETGKLPYQEVQMKPALRVDQPCRFCQATDTGIVGMENGQPVRVCLRASCRRGQTQGYGVG
jgi:hypothetical protein